MSNLFPGIVPSAAALAVASMIVLASDVIPNAKQRVHFQFFFFGAAFAIATFLLLIAEENQAGIVQAWEAFVALPSFIRFLVSLAVFSATYFGAGLFVASPVTAKDSSSASTSSVDPKELFKTPASCDNFVGFDVPAVLPQGEKEFFVFMLDKYVSAYHDLYLFWWSLNLSK